MPAEPISRDLVVSYAAQALADAMAYTYDAGLDMGPTDEMQRRADEIVRGVLDMAGSRFTVLLEGSEADAKRLAAACGKNGSHTDEALLVIRRLVEESQL